MNAKKCDRCGAFYESSKNYYDKLKINDVTRGNIRLFDLCDDCRTEFINYISFYRPELSREFFEGAKDDRKVFSGADSSYKEGTTRTRGTDETIDTTLA